jgi:hypothetical protein
MSEEHDAFVFRVEGYAKEATSMKQMLLFGPKHGGCTFL